MVCGLDASFQYGGFVRTHTCGELRAKHAGKKTTLCGWLDSLRIKGKIGFLVIRDRYGKTQVFLNENLSRNISNLRRESVIMVTGEVKKRPKSNVNREMETGEIEVNANNIEILNEAKPIPMELDESIESTPETRLKYRFLDLRRQKMQKNIALRYRTIRAIRDFLDKEMFLEIETPILAKSTPEGSRDYLVPSRNFKGKFYALPQSPQLFKQLLMVSCYDKYFQIARCFRDEDLRADRDAEFTQLDIEMSFVKEEDILNLIERLMKYVWKNVLDQDIKTPFPRIPYRECMEKYGTDKPHLGEGKDGWHFAWIVNWPMFEKDDDGNWTYTHHPFTMPKFKNIEDIVKNPGEVGGSNYDLVLNGEELGGGSIRIHDTEIQRKVFEALGLTKKEYEDKFGFLLKAFDYGCPPHGGIAFGLDRIIALMSGSDTIRDVIAFPKNKDAADPMLDAPSSVTKEQLDELGIKTKE